MDLIAERGPARYYQIVVDQPDDFVPPFRTRPYTCMLWDTRGDAAPEERERLGRKLVESGCAYAVCGGATCRRWHDAIDEALIALQLEGMVPSDHVLMTTWHERESMDEIAEFFVFTAVPAEGEITQHLVLQIGQDWDRQNDLWSTVHSHALYG